MSDDRDFLFLGDLDQPAVRFFRQITVDLDEVVPVCRLTLNLSGGLVRRDRLPCAGERTRRVHHRTQHLTGADLVAQPKMVGLAPEVEDRGDTVRHEEGQPIPRIIGEVHVSVGQSRHHELRAIAVDLKSADRH